MTLTTATLGDHLAAQRINDRTKSISDVRLTTSEEQHQKFDAMTAEAESYRSHRAWSGGSRFNVLARGFPVFFDGNARAHHIATVEKTLSKSATKLGPKRDPMLNGREFGGKIS